jgi:O-acetyl-ADP-ribose deacetylase (regulator of RNase III)
MGSTMSIEFKIGDATKPVGVGPTIIVHVCNDIGGWGRGFVKALSERWPEPEKRYRAWYRGEEAIPFVLGEVQFIAVEAQLWVANLIGQHDIKTIGGVPPIRYEAVRVGLRKVSAEASRLGAAVHMPRIGCGLAGGNWEEINKIIAEELVGRGVEVVVYDLPQSSGRPP